MFSFTPWPIYPWVKSADTNWIGDWVGPRAGLDAVENRKILSLPGIEPGPSPYRLSYLDSEYME
jgi:hypothetical protein